MVHNERVSTPVRRLLDHLMRGSNRNSDAMNVCFTFHLQAIWGIILKAADLKPITQIVG
jgi:hypothetical protein